MTETQRPDDEEIAPEEAEDDLLPADDLMADAPEAVRKQLRRRLKTEGARVAIDTMLAVCLDPKAQSSARATCSVGLLRAAGYLGKKAEEEDEESSALDQATASELEQFLRWSRARARAQTKPTKKRVRGADDIGSSSGVGALD
jgi:hypothetical protein